MVEVFAAYSRLWALSEIVVNHGTMFLSPGCEAFSAAECASTPWWFIFEMVLWVAVLVRPTRATVTLSMLTRVAQYRMQSPFIWESCHWADATELAFVAVLQLCPLEAAVHEAAGLVRTMMGLFYIGAGFWKMNTSFLDARVSCGSIYVASLLATFLPPALRPEWLVAPLVASAPWATILGETAIGVLLLVPRRAAQRVGFVLSNLLHYAICVTPYPNAVPLFGVFCYTRLFFVMPEAWTAALREAASPAASARGAAARAAAVALAAASASCTSEPGVTVNPGIPAQTLLCLLGARAVALDVQGAGAWTMAAPSRRASIGPGRAALLKANAAAWLLAVTFYVFLAQPLGLISISGTSPFAQIREHGGSNHLFMPTGLLQQWPASRRLDAFGGGVVRVTASSSDYLNALYPANFTFELRPEIRQMLLAHGHIAQEYHPTVMRMFGPRIRSILPHWPHPAVAGKDAPFPRYTIPGLELRRMLAEVRALGEGFTITYERLPGVVGDEAWRHSAVEATVTLSEDGRGGRRCTVRASGALFASACADDEVALLPLPTGLLSRLVMHFLVWFPYPIVPGLDVLPCID